MNAAIGSVIKAILFASAIALAFSMPAEAARRALVIGISNYDSSGIKDLDNPPADVAAVVPKLRGSGFQVTIAQGSQTSRSELLKAFSDFIGKIGDGDEVLVYYTGHGISLQGKNRIVPKDAPSSNDVRGEGLLASQLIPINQMMEDIKDQANVSQFWVIDACRTNPYAQPSRAYTSAQGLSKLEGLPGDVYVLFSAEEGMVAKDRLPSDAPGVNRGSPFARAFVASYDGWKNQWIEQFVKEVARRVVTDVAPDIQRPDVSGMILGQWCLEKCSTTTGMSILDLQMKRTLDQLNALYRPLNTLLKAGDAEWAMFAERLRTQYGATYPLKASGQPISTNIANSETMWSVWINEVRTRFKPHNDRLAKLITDNPSLAEDEDANHCFREFIAHKTAFEDSLTRVDANPSLRVWNVAHPWPACLVPRVQAVVDMLAAREVKATSMASKP
jgi:hypothetical protein